MGEVHDLQADLGHHIAEDHDLVDAGLLNLRTAYSCFTATLKRFREDGEHVGSVLFIENYAGELQPIVHRATV